MFRRDPSEGIAPCGLKTSAIDRGDAQFGPCSSLQTYWEACASHTALLLAYKPSAIVCGCLGDAPRQLPLPPCRYLRHISRHKQGKSSGQRARHTLKSELPDAMLTLHHQNAQPRVKRALSRESKGRSRSRGGVGGGEKEEETQR